MHICVMRSQERFRDHETFPWYGVKLNEKIKVAFSLLNHDLLLLFIFQASLYIWYL